MSIIRFRPVTIVGCLVFLLFGCSPRESVLSVAHAQCEPPCWYGVEMGMAKAEAVQLVSGFPEIDGSSFSEIDRDDGGYVYWGFTEDVREKWLRLDYKDDRIFSIFIRADNTSTMDDLVRRYGEPEFIATIAIYHDSRGVAVLLLYPSRGIGFSYSDVYYSPKGIKVTPEMPVDRVWFYDPAEITSAHQEAFLIGTGVDDEALKESTQPWQGFDVEYPIIDY